ncbi:cytoplasmic tRNA 2-thiolation protein 1 [Plakobranchus ocellatus]|uniref:Cytoplasmic tRNA 2-thiolation protein 1 n=1 Tax=Plakobranchus ocellatus TaxID=259542 RepID=A0AAV4DZ55_9GAST|nr:cytoplasmic tRNA 2-thiolation protein 1 [Plakobranchus ocellatus]
MAISASDGKGRRYYIHTVARRVYIHTVANGASGGKTRQGFIHTVAFGAFGRKSRRVFIHTMARQGYIHMVAIGASDGKGRRGYIHSVAISASEGKGRLDYIKRPSGPLAGTVGGTLLSVAPLAPLAGKVGGAIFTQCHHWHLWRESVTIGTSDGKARRVYIYTVARRGYIHMVVIGACGGKGRQGYINSVTIGTSGGKGSGQYSHSVTIGASSGKGSGAIFIWWSSGPPTGKVGRAIFTQWLLGPLAGKFKPHKVLIEHLACLSDSTVLAHTMKVLNERHNYRLKLILLSVDEGITGYRDDSLETVKRNQQQYDLPLTIVSYEELYGWTMDAIVQQIGLKNNCTFCGVFRRQALDRGAMKLGATKIVTGHNADDIAETVIMNVLRGDIARLRRCTAITTGADGYLPRCKPFKYTYEKEIVMYAYFKQLDYFSTECIYSPNAYRGYARTYIKDLEKIRPSAIIDIIHSGESLSVKKDVKMPTQTICSVCKFISSNEVCKACVLLEGLNKGRPRLGIGKTHKERRKWEEDLAEEAQRLSLQGSSGGGCSYGCGDKDESTSSSSSCCGGGSAAGGASGGCCKTSGSKGCSSEKSSKDGKRPESARKPRVGHILDF